MGTEDARGRPAARVVRAWNETRACADGERKEAGLQDLRMQTFLTVCDTMNFTQAARILHITQPAVSQQIHFLEEHYRTKLFVYSGKKLMLTRAGQLLRQAGLAMRNDEAMLLRMMHEETPADIRLNFGVTKTIGEYVIARPLAHFLKHHPLTSVNMEIGNTDELLTEMKEGRIQFALIEGSYDPREYETLQFANVPFVPVCSARHWFPRKPARLRDLLGERLIIREPGSGTRNLLENQMKTLDLEPDDFSSVIQVGGMHAILQLLEEDAGISFMYLSAASKKIYEGTLQEIELDDFHVNHDFTFLWEKGSVYSERYRRICLQLREEQDKLAYQRIGAGGGNGREASEGSGAFYD